jgi:hypothetical protein
MCTHYELQEVCGAGGTPFANEARGWYGDRNAEKLGFFTWQYSTCASDNLDGAMGYDQGSLPFRCCRAPYFSGDAGSYTSSDIVRLGSTGTWEAAASTTGPACCAGFDTSTATFVAASDVATTSNVDVASVSNIFAISSTDSKYSTREGVYWTMFTISRYDPDGTNQGRIFQSSDATTTWYTGFDSGNAGVANHHGDYITETTDHHSEDGAWVVTTSTEYSFRSNFVERPLRTSDPTANSLFGVDLVINNGDGNDSDWQISEVLVLHTSHALSEDEIEDIERCLFRRNVPLFIRGHYTTDGYHENSDGDDLTWDDTGIYGRHADLSSSADFSLQDEGDAGFVVNGTKGSSITFPSDLIPAEGGEFTMLVVGTTSDGSAVMSVSNDDELQDCLDGATPSTWGVGACEEEGPNVKIVLTDSTKPLILCEVEVLTTEVRERERDKQKDYGGSQQFND